MYLIATLWMDEIYQLMFQFLVNQKYRAILKACFKKKYCFPFKSEFLVQFAMTVEVRVQNT